LITNIHQFFNTQIFNMKLILSTLAIGTLLTQAWGSPAQSTANNEPECYGGGMEQNPPLSGPNTPPCWYKQSNGKYHCYDYNQGTNQCPWPGYEDPKPGNKKPAECYGGGMRQYPPLVNPNTPPCWYKQSDGKYDCYDYKQGTQECPWSGYENPKPQ
jgi:hypothetical protein